MFMNWTQCEKSNRNLLLLNLNKITQSCDMRTGRHSSHSYLLDLTYLNLYLNLTVALEL